MSKDKNTIRCKNCSYPVLVQGDKDSDFMFRSRHGFISKGGDVILKCKCCGEETSINLKSFFEFGGDDMEINPELYLPETCKTKRLVVE